MNAKGATWNCKDDAEGKDAVYEGGVTLNEKGATCEWSGRMLCM